MSYTCYGCGGISDREHGACVWCRLRAEGRAARLYAYNPDAALTRIRQLVNTWVDDPLTPRQNDELAELVTELIYDLDDGGPLPTSWAGPRREPPRSIEDIQLPDSPEAAPSPLGDGA